MRLLSITNEGRLNLTEYVGGEIPPYAILSHTWEGHEVTFDDLKNLGNAEDIDAQTKEGYQKIRFCGLQAKRDGLDYFWVDTCCIDKWNSMELSEAINSMFYWYQNADRCYVSLSDVENQPLDVDGESSWTWKAAFRKSRWFTRGWTLQELLAPNSVEFFSKYGERLGDKKSLEYTIHEITGIPVDALQGRQLSEFTVSERFSWAENRHTTCEEDGAYSLLGIFAISMPLMYGEGEGNAMIRLQRELKAHSTSMNNTETRSGSRKEKLEKICGWLSAPDPSKNYHSARARRQAGTGLWLLESTEFRVWKKSAGSRMWLYGIPGCGKTILSSTIIEALLQHCSDLAMDAEMMLRSLLSQLLKRLATTPTGPDALFSSSEGRYQQLTLHGLLRMIMQIVSQFTHVYVVLDALDECTQRYKLLDILETVAGWQLDNMHLLVTSRKERDIESSLEAYIEREDTICLQSHVVENDIKRYVQQRLSEGEKLARWRKEVRQEIAITLMDSAHRSFQWAACQLDTLERCHNLRMLHRLLASLPPTLDHTYDRILSAISKEDAKYAVRILRWLRFSARTMSVVEMAQAVAIDGDSGFDRDEVLEDPLDMQYICPGLVTVAGDGSPTFTQATITLAHYSIWEYLASERIKQGPAMYYSMQEAECHNTIAKGCLNYLMQFQQPITEEGLEAYTLAGYAANFWSVHLRRAREQGEETSQVAAKFFTAGNPAFHNWVQLYNSENPLKPPQNQNDTDQTSAPIYYAALFELDRVVELLLEAGADPNVQGGYYGNALQVASCVGSGSIVKLLLGANADPNAQGGRYYNALQAATENGHEDIAKLLRGATHAKAGSRIAPTDSGYASQRQGDDPVSPSIQDPIFEQTFYPEEETNVQALSSCDVEAYLDDIRSIESDCESIGSKAPTSRSNVELYAIRYLASFFAQLRDLRSLHEVALQRIERKRFTQNYRRILKSYYRRLLCEAATDTEKEVTKVLRSRRNRESIAEGIADHLEYLEQEEPVSLEKLMAQPAEKEYLEDWLSRNQNMEYDQQREADQEPNVDDHHSESSDSASELDVDSEADDNGFLNINRAEKFLLQGLSFRNLVLDIRLWMLPGHIREIVETTPKNSLRILSQNDNSWINRIKASLETYTELEWDWWPLAPRVPSMGIEEHHLQWKLCGRTLYVKMLQDQADALREVLKMADDHPSKCHCCVAKPPKALGVTFGSISRSFLSLLSRQRSGMAGGTSSRAAKAYTPAPGGTSGASSSTKLPASGGASANSVALNQNGTQKTTQAQGGSTIVPPPTAQVVPTRIVFGIQGVRRSLEIEQIEICGQMNDQVFFSELKARYKKHRSSFLRFLSPFRFRYCNFVKFQKLNVNRVFSRGEGLPDPDGFAHDYDYFPRHPTARMPLIDPGLFAVYLESCDEDCMWSILGSRLHDCFHLPPSFNKLKCIPKKKSEFAVQSEQNIDDVAWGIEADYALSHLYLSVYHLIPLLSGFGFWVYWLICHPGDWQNASVPFLTTVALMAVFWVPFGLSFNSNLRVGHR